LAPNRHKSEQMRMTYKLTLGIVLLGVLMLLLPSSVVKADETVAFPDANLEAAVRDAIGKTSGDIYRSDLKGLTVLSANSKGIADLGGLEYCTCLTYLSLRDNQIGDISPLCNLASLMQLDLGGNLISDIATLSGLASLTWLRLDNNLISDVTPLSSLTNLAKLDLGENQIRDIAPLSHLTSLMKLDLGENQIRDISSLSNLTGLTQLYLEKNQVTDISPLVENHGLNTGDTLDLSENPLSGTSVGVYIPQLEQRRVEVWWRAAPPSNSRPGGKASFSIWVVIGLVLGLMVLGGVTYYFVFMRWVPGKRMLRK
jgi:hypothetical protein